MANIPQINIAITGPRGTGKKELAKSIADHVRQLLPEVDVWTEHDNDRRRLSTFGPTKLVKINIRRNRGPGQ